MITTDIYAIKYFNDEVGVELTDCKQPWSCECINSETKCGYSPEEIQKKVVEYYQNRAKAVSSLTPEQFMAQYGIYL